MFKIKTKTAWSVYLWLVIVCITATADTLPDLGTPSEAILSSKQKRLLGMRFEAAIHHYLPLMHDPVVNDYLESMVTRLVSYADLKGGPVKLFVSNNSTVNALAGPNHIIVINSGTVLLSQNPSQLASVLAHEIGHLSHHHIDQGIARQKRLSWTTLAGILATIAAGASGNMEAAQGTLASTMAATNQSMINYTRAHEQEADNASLDLLYQAGYNPMAMPAFFELMKKQNVASDSLPQFLKTHPHNASRIATTIELASQYPTVNPKTDVRYRLVKERLRVLTQSNTTDLANSYKTALRGAQGKALKEGPLRYGYALYLENQGQWQSALEQIQPLYESQPDQLYYALLYTDILANLGRIKSALRIMKSQNGLYPDSVMASQHYANLLSQAGDNKKAISVIRAQLINHPDHVGLLNALAHLYHKQGEPIRSKLALAKAYAEQKRWDLAVIQLKHLLRKKPLDKDRKNIVRARLERYNQLRKAMETHFKR